MTSKLSPKRTQLVKKPIQVKTTPPKKLQNQKKEQSNLDRKINQEIKKPPVSTKSNNKPPPKEKEKEWWEKLLDYGGELLPKVLPMVLEGLGDYEVETNSLVAQATNGKLGNEVPIMSNSKCYNIIRHREYIGDIYSTTSGFVNTTFQINPGLDQIFPWLSLIANNYEAYRFRGLIFEFKSEGSEYTNAVGLGYVALSTQYNVKSPPFVDKKTMLNQEFSNSAKPSESFIHPIECNPDQLVCSELFTRAGTVTADSDLKLYDMGVLNIAVGGMTTANVIIGELWCSYEIELYRPKSAGVPGLNVQYDAFQLGAVSGPNPFGTSALLVSSPVNNLGLVVSTQNSTITFPTGVRGRYMLTYSIQQTSGAITWPIVTYTNTTNLWPTGPPSGPAVAPQNGVTTTAAMYQSAFDVLVDGVVITFGNAGTISASSAAWLQITQLPRTTVGNSVFDFKGQNNSKIIEQAVENYCDKEKNIISSDWDDDDLYTKLMKKYGSDKAYKIINCLKEEAKSV